MNSILPLWSTSPLDQFTIRNLFSLKADILGNFQISFTNIGLYLVIATLIIFMFYTLARNYEFTTPNGWSLSMESIYATVHSIVTNQINVNKGQNNLTFNSPKAHAFIITEFKSATVYGIPALDIVTIISSHLYSMVNAYVTLDLLYQTSGLATSFLVNNIEMIIRGIEEINTQLPTSLNNGLGLVTLTQIHIDLTSHLTQIQGVTYLLQHNIGFSGGSPDLNQLQDLMTRLSGSTRTLLFHYRGVESAIGIPLNGSPITSQVWGF